MHLEREQPKEISSMTYSLRKEAAGHQEAEVEEAHVQHVDHIYQQKTII